jgi:hypothetical protein
VRDTTNAEITACFGLFVRQEQAKRPIRIPRKARPWEHLASTERKKPVSRGSLTPDSILSLVLCIPENNHARHWERL